MALSEPLSADELVRVVRAVAGFPWPMDVDGFIVEAAARLGWTRLPGDVARFDTGLPPGASRSSAMAGLTDVDEVSMNLRPLGDASPELDAELNDVFADRAAAMVAAFGKPFVKRAGRMGRMRWRVEGSVVELRRSDRTLGLRVWPEASYEWMRRSGAL